jgi:hypothetical protein
LKGSLGKELVFREWEGKTIVSKSPKSQSGESTAAQAGTREKFMWASRYAKAITKSADQSLAEGYASALKPRQNVYSRALEDFMSAPVVKSIDPENYKGVSGGTIIIRATDDFRVTSVHVEIYASNGTPIEAGNAVQNLNGIDWTYNSRLSNNMVADSRIRAVARDVPGNEGVLEVRL